MSKGVKKGLTMTAVAEALRSAKGDQHHGAVPVQWGTWRYGEEAEYKLNCVSMLKAGITSMGISVWKWLVTCILSSKCIIINMKVQYGTSVVHILISLICTVPFILRRVVVSLKTIPQDYNTCFWTGEGNWSTQRHDSRTKHDPTSHYAPNCIVLFKSIALLCQYCMG